jgi:glycosyltransferase involved in cell wall biosynthesis
MLISKPSSNRPRVLFVLPPFLPTPPQGYGGIEAVAAALLPELQRQGARITVTTPEGSDIKVSEVRTITEPLYSLMSKAFEFVNPKVELYITKVLHLAWQKHFDVIHDFSGLYPMISALAAPQPGGKFPPVIHTMHGPIQPFRDNFLELARFPGITYTAISKSQLSEAPLRVRKRSQVIYNCLNLDDFQPGQNTGRYLVLGRFRDDKGQDRLIEYCARAGIGLDVAGPVAEMTDLAEIEAEVAKGKESQYADNPSFQLFLKVHHLIDGQQIRFHGNVGGELKQRLLREAKALVVPNRWAEPFGMVAIEAMASGTPVIAMNSGAMPELIEHGVTGYLTDTFEELCRHLSADTIGQLDRTACRPHVEANFSAGAIAAQYLSLYRRLAQSKTMASSLNLGLQTQRQEVVLYERLPTSEPPSKSGL